jgi:hypothetical protein
MSPARMLPPLLLALTLVNGVTSSLRAQEPGRQRPTQHGLVERGSIWPTLNISVCWEQDLTAFRNETSWVLTAVHDTIETNSNYNLSTQRSWPQCPNDDEPRIRILLEDTVDVIGKEVPPHSEVGYQHTTSVFGFVIPRATHMHINFTFQHSFTNCATSRQNCIQVIAVHEILHALGFLHEQYNTNLKVTDPACYTRIEPTFAGDTSGIDPWPVTDYDPDSIMNYCRNIYSEPPRLSHLDITTLGVLAAASAFRMGSAR